MPHRDWFTYCSKPPHPDDPRHVALDSAHQYLIAWQDQSPATPQ